MFPKNEKLHEMKTRDTPKFAVQYADKDRLNNSAIIHMQNLLNKNEMKNLNKNEMKNS